MMVGIQADDLTGACDTGAPFAARGLETLVVVHDGETSPPDTTVDVLVVDTESRELSEAEARERARATAKTLGAAAPGILYKKLDSTLRGHVAAEVDGMLDGAGRGAALLAPAFPAQRRTVVDGRLQVDGRLADDTAIAHDPTFPRTGASVLGLLAAGGVRPLGAVPLATVRRGAGAVTARLERFSGAGGRVLVADAETDADLSALVEAARGRPVLLAGSAGLGTALAGHEAHGAARRRRVLPHRPLVVVAGSANPASRAQLRRLGHRDGLHVLTAPDDRGANDPVRRLETVARLADETRMQAERARPGALLLTGGETAIAVLRRLGARGLRLAGELEPGLALGTLAGGPFDGLAVMTKAGGFGDVDTLVRAWEACA